jgi:hypothetical protein
LWDGVHTVIRPVGGALLALAVVDPRDPTWQVVVLLLGGGAALLSHSAKAGARVVVNASPEPVSNMVLSTGEDVVSAGGLLLVLSHPNLAIAVAAVLLVFVAGALFLGWKLVGSLKRLFARTPPRPRGPGALN